MGKVGALLALIAVSVTPLHAQRLRDRILDLFSFGTCGAPLCLDGSVSVANGHGDHFLPDVISGNQAIIGFLTGAVATSSSSIPLGSSSSGHTFKFVNGLPVRTSNSAGPIFGERAQTLGKGRVLVGTNLSSINFKTIRGTPLDQLVFNLAHEDRPPTGLGDPLLENDILEVRMDLAMDLLVSTFFVTYGVSDRVDFGVAVPLVHTSFRGRSTGQIFPFGSTAVHFFTGTEAAPGLRATAATFGSATGIGDIALRLKGNLVSSDQFGFAILGDARLPTGNEGDLLGAGHFSMRGSAIASAQFGGFAPHINLGYLLWTGPNRSDAFLAAVGFDQPMSSWANFAADILSEWQIGETGLEVPGPIQFILPFPRTVIPTNIADRKDHRVLGTFGFKFQTSGGPLIVASGLVPLKAGGLQPYAAWNLGLEFSF